MNKKIITIFFVSLLSIILTGCTIKKSDNKVSNTQEISEEQSLKGSLFDLVGLNKNVKCTFEVKNEGGESSGVTYVSGKKAKSEMSVNIEGQENISIYTLVLDDYFYTWGNNSSQGTKMKISDLQGENQPNIGSEADNNSYQDYKNEFDFDCKVWIPDNSKFEIPTNIEFTDMTEMIKNVQDQAGKMEDNLKEMCDMCDIMPTEEEKSECRSNLNCE